jgi:hypothetical protein
MSTLLLAPWAHLTLKTVLIFFPTTPLFQRLNQSRAPLKLSSPAGHEAFTDEPLTGAAQKGSLIDIRQDPI